MPRVSHPVNTKQTFLSPFTKGFSFNDFLTIFTYIYSHHQEIPNILTYESISVFTVSSQVIKSNIEKIIIPTYTKVTIMLSIRLSELYLYFKI